MISLGAVEAALFAALARINPGAAGTGTNATARDARVARIARWLGEPLRTSAMPDYYRAALQREFKNAPALLLGFDGEVLDGGANTVETLSGNAETVGRATWTVLCAGTATRDTALVMHGASGAGAGSVGVYDLQALVEAALNNLGIDGLYSVSNVRFQDTRAYMIVPGELYVLALRFTTRRVLADAREEGTDQGYLDDGEPYTGLDARANLYPVNLAGDQTANPFVLFRGGTGALPADVGAAPPVTGLVAWYSGARVNGLNALRETLPLPSAGSRVARWEPVFGLGRPLSQPDPDAQPSREDTTLLGAAVPGVVFSAGDSLYGPHDALPVGTDARTVAVVVVRATVGATVQHLAGWGDESGDPLRGFDVQLIPVSGAGVQPGVQLGGAPVTSGFAYDGADPLLVVADYDGTTARVRAFPFAGAGAQSTQAAALATRNDRDLRFARAGTLDGVLGDVLVWGRVLSDADLTELRAWAAAVYGIAGT